MKKYIFRRADNEELIQVDFGTMMTMDSLGEITLEGGVKARRCRYLEEDTKSAPPKEGAASIVEKPIVSDALGCTSTEVENWRADAAKHGFVGLDWKPDPLVPGFYQLHFSGASERERYLKHRHMVDGNKTLGSGATLSQADLDQAAALVLRSLEERQQSCKEPLPVLG